MSRSRVRLGLILLTGFLGVTAVAGGIGLLTGVVAPPLSSLRGSPFTDYTIPAWALLVVVGGGGLIAMLAAWARSPLAAVAAGVAAIAILVFEAVEISVIGLTLLQLVYVAVGAAILLLAMLALPGLEERPYGRRSFR